MTTRAHVVLTMMITLQINRSKCIVLCPHSAMLPRHPLFRIRSVIHIKIFNSFFMSDHIFIRNYKSTNPLFRNGESCILDTHLFPMSVSLSHIFRCHQFGVFVATQFSVSKWVASICMFLSRQQIGKLFCRFLFLPPPFRWEYPIIIIGWLVGCPDQARPDQEWVIIPASILHSWHWVLFLFPLPPIQMRISNNPLSRDAFF